MERTVGAQPVANLVQPTPSGNNINEVSSKEEDIERFFKFQGVNNLCDFLNENQKVADFIYAKVKELF